MTTSAETPNVQSTGVLVARVLAAVIGTLATMCWLMLLSLPILSLLHSSDRSYDPHGYGMVFGMLMSVPAAVVAAVIMPFALPQRWWVRGFAVTFAVAGVVEAALFAVLYVLNP